MTVTRAETTPAQRFMADALSNRAERLQKRLVKDNVDVFVSTGLLARVWLLNSSAPGAVLLADGEARAVPPGEVTTELIRRKVRRIAVDDEVSLSTALSWCAKVGCELVAGGSAFRAARAAKDRIELAVMSHARGIAEHAFKAFEQELRPGLTELQLAQKFESAARVAGSDGAYYELSFAAGQRTSRPWAGVTLGEVRPGEPLLVDAGVWYRRYRCDLTRAYWIPGPRDTDRRRNHERLLRAARSVRDVILAELRAGIPVAHIAAVANSALAPVKDRLNARMPHVVAHGIGLEVHEEPVVSHRSQLVLEPGMVLAVEPGLYTAEQGARLEEL
ncbi:MAG TPA: M24 family metallopeptidase, partial [Micromonosporaceae bacterium]|nr:M24 family metallopeptidase [Micromonosporaceae bacterium]